MEKLAELYIRSWEGGAGRPSEMIVQQWEQVGCNEEEEDIEVGTKVPCPEVAAVWDPLERWVEEGRWVWGKEEHNNILEARASVIAAKMATMGEVSWRKRHLMISDSQVVIGSFSKGRSSKGLLNYVTRKLAAIVISTGCRFYWRYIRTHRNHSDGPSRGYPLGVAPKSVEEMEEIFQRTRG